MKILPFLFLFLPKQITMPLTENQQEAIIHAIRNAFVQYLYPSRTLVANSTGVSLKTSPGGLGRVNIVNTAASVIYVKFYDKATAATSADTPIATIQVASSGSYIDSYVIPKLFSLGLSVRAVTGSADNDTTNPATAPIIEVETTN